MSVALSTRPAFELLEAVTAAAGALLDADLAILVRRGDDGVAIAQARWPAHGEVPGRVLAALGSARVHEWCAEAGPAADRMRELGFRSSAGAPIVVDGGLWGALSVHARRPRLASDAGARLGALAEPLAAILAHTRIDDEEARAALTASRLRILLDADKDLRRLERHLHHGPQQRLASLALELRLAQSSANPEVANQIARVVTGVNAVLDDLRGFSDRLHPGILSEGGLGPALRSLARRSDVPVTIAVAVDDRFEAHLETAAYRVVAETLTNVASHDSDSAVEVRTVRLGDRLIVTIRGDGVGVPGADAGAWLMRVTDRVDALGGTTGVTRGGGSAGMVEVTLPIRAR